MKILNVKQGSSEWHKARLKSFTASEAAAMMGKSKYMTRTELLELKKTGVQKKVSPHTQMIFNKGHDTEALARPIIEKKYSEEFYPVTGSVDIDGMQILASFDGLTMMEDILFEHKLLNYNLAKKVLINELPEQYYWQLEQQLLVSGADKAIFVVSDGTEENMHIMEYYPGIGKREELIAGWMQFAIDLENLTVEAPEEKPVTTEIAELPVLSIMINGEVSSSNLGVYQNTALNFISEINTNLQTDSDFAQAEVTIKFCDKAERELQSIKKQALAQTSDIDLLFKTVDSLTEELRQKRLTLTKLVKTQKEQIKKDIIAEADLAMGEHIISLHGSLSGLKVPVINIDFPGVIKGKRNLASMRDAVNTELARAKIETNKLADVIQANLRIVEVLNEHKFLFNDLQEICSKDSISFAAIAESRINKYHEEEEIKAEAMRKKIREEEEAKAEHEANRKLEEERAALRAEAQKRANEAEAEIAKTKKANLEKQIQEERDREKIRIEEKQKLEKEEQKHQDLLDEHEQVTEHELCCSREFLPTSAPGDIPLPEIKQKLEDEIELPPFKSMQKTVYMMTITKQEYNSLVADSRFLQALFSVGVDNWTGYVDAQNLIDQ